MKLFNQSAEHHCQYQTVSGLETAFCSDPLFCIEHECAQSSDVSHAQEAEDHKITPPALSAILFGIGGADAVELSSHGANMYPGSQEYTIDGQHSRLLSLKQLHLLSECNIEALGSLTQLEELSLNMSREINRPFHAPSLSESLLLTNGFAAACSSLHEGSDFLPIAMLCIACGKVLL